MNDFLDRSHSVAEPGFSRWLVPPAALCIHLAIGQAYAFSVFNKPMSQLIGITAPATGDWSIPALGWIFSLAIVFLGLAAAVGGKWVEDVGPRKAMFASALCFSGGLLVAGGGVARASTVARLSSGYGVSRWHRTRHRVHFSRLDVDQVVSRSPRPCYRYGDHGLRWRRTHRGTACRHVDQALLDRNLHRRRAHNADSWVVIYLCFMLVGRVHRSRAARRLEAGRLRRKRRRRASS